MPASLSLPFVSSPPSAQRAPLRPSLSCPFSSSQSTLSFASSLFFWPPCNSSRSRFLALARRPSQVGLARRFFLSRSRTLPRPLARFKQVVLVRSRSSGIGTRGREGARRATDTARGLERGQDEVGARGRGPEGEGKSSSQKGGRGGEGGRAGRVCGERTKGGGRRVHEGGGSRRRRGGRDAAKGDEDGTQGGHNYRRRRGYAGMCAGAKK